MCWLIGRQVSRLRRRQTERYMVGKEAGKMSVKRPENLSIAPIWKPIHSRQPDRLCIHRACGRRNCRLSNQKINYFNRACGRQNGRKRTGQLAVSIGPAAGQYALYRYDQFKFIGNCLSLYDYVDTSATASFNYILINFIIFNSIFFYRITTHGKSKKFCIFWALICQFSLHKTTLTLAPPLVLITF